MNVPNRSKTRPSLVTWLSIGVLILAAIQLIRFFAALRLPDLGYAVPIWYLALRNGLWFVLMMGIGIGLFSGMQWALKWIKLATLLLVVWYWLDRLILVQSNSSLESIALPALFSLVSLALFFGILSRQKVRNFFEE
jgi:lipoprotein signal peptidase